MASKIHTDNPNHHKWVSVNKRERKKSPKRLIRLLSLFVPCKYLGRIIEWHFGFHYRYYAEQKDNMPNTKVIYDDCNHKSYRLMRRKKGGWYAVGHMSPLSRDHYSYLYLQRRPRRQRLFRQSAMGYNEQVMHFKRNDYF